MVPELLTAHGVKLYALCSYGRSGTSFLMGLLSALEVGVAGPFPYEERASQTLFLSWLRREFQMEDASGVATASEYAEHFSGVDYASTLFDKTTKLPQQKTLFVDWIRSLPTARVHGIAEKFVGLDLLRIMQAFDGGGAIKPVYLLRDPRDIFISIKNFNAKRGFCSFNDSGDDLLLLDTICNYENGQLNMFRRSGGLLCYYEDLVTYQERALVQLGAYVGHEAMTSQRLLRLKNDMEKHTEAVRDHMTSIDPSNSIHRWKTSADVTNPALFESRAKAISRLGYQI